LIDTEYLKHIEQDQKKRNKTIVCKKGCCECCINQAVPITQVELQGISWYAIEKLNNPLRDQVKEQLRIYKQIKHCPFLINKACSIYPMRPIACRTFFVYTKTCIPDEDILSSRPSDILLGSREIARQSAFILLQAFGITDKNKQIHAFEAGLIKEMSQPMHELDWSAFYTGMGKYDSGEFQ
jgi:Fe-S-cluster containining protein